MTLKRLGLQAALAAVLPAVALAVAIALGGPGTPPPAASFHDPFQSVDFSDLAPLRHFAARDGARLAYRVYAPAMPPARASVVLVHGSSASNASMHVLAQAFAAAGFAAYALDMRGHGASGDKGRIDHIGQLEEDLQAFMEQVAPAAPSTLVGFSSGGGFVLRFAGSARQDAFHSYLLLSPYLGPDAPNYRPTGGGWVEVGVPRIVAIAVLHAAGIRAFGDLPVVRFALDERAQALLTPHYSFTLAMNFQPQRDYQANIRAVRHPVSVVAGADDEAFLVNTLQGIFRAQNQDWPVTLVPGIGHIALTLDPVAVSAAVQAVRHMQRPRAGPAANAPALRGD